MPRTLRVAAATLVASVAGVAPDASAGDADLASVEIRYVCESTGCPPPFLVVEGSSREERISIHRAEDADEYEITDDAGLTSDNPQCRALSPIAYRCGPTQSRIVVNGRHGDDRVTLGAGLSGLAQLQPGPGDDYVSVDRDSAANAYTEGAEGNDQIFGGASKSRDPLTGIRGDVLVGSEGRDVLRGRSGPDEIIGGHDADAAYGGPGDDRLIMAGSGTGGNDVDRVIDCGPGQDVAIVIPRFDPAPVDCERVRRPRR